MDQEIIVTVNKKYTRFGIPIFIDEDGNLISGAEGIRYFRQRYQWSVSDLGKRCSVSGRTVEGWEQGKKIGVRSLLCLAHVIKRQEKSREERI